MWGWLVFGLSGFVHISTVNNEDKRRSQIFKLLALLSLIALLLFSAHDEPQFIWVFSGLVCSLLAEILGQLSQPRVKVIFGLMLITFLAYSKGFWTQLSGDISWWLPALLFAGSVILFLLLLPKLDTIVFPVSIMGLVLVNMSWAASAVWMGNATQANLMACIACLIFVASAVLKAVHHYRAPIEHAEKWLASGYFAAQALIVASVIY